MMRIIYLASTFAIKIYANLDMPQWKAIKEQYNKHSTLVKPEKKKWFN